MQFLVKQCKLKHSKYILNVSFYLLELIESDNDINEPLEKNCWNILPTSKKQISLIIGAYDEHPSRKQVCVTNTPLQPTFIVKLGFTGIYIIFLFLL